MFILFERNYGFRFSFSGRLNINHFVRNHFNKKIHKMNHKQAHNKKVVLNNWMYELHCYVFFN